MPRLMLVITVLSFFKYQWKQKYALLMPMIIKKAIINNKIYIIKELHTFS